MTKLNDIYSSYGKEFSVIVANTYGYNILNTNKLIGSSLIIASPYDKNIGEDVGQHSLFVTDYEGNVTRLTYDIHEGNGLVFKDDSLSLKTDNVTMFERNGKLTASLENIVDGKTITSKNGKIYAVAENLEYATKSKPGLLKIDNSTVKTSEGQLYVDTSMLDKASSGISGIIEPDNRTVISNNGVLSVVSSNLDKASNTKLGIAKVDNTTIKSSDGVIYTSSELLKNLSNQSGLKLVKVDNDTIKKSNGVIYVDESTIPYASSSTYGKVKIDNNTLYVGNDGKIHPKVQDYAMSYIYDYNEALDLIEDRVTYLNEVISTGLTAAEPDIYSLSCNETTTSVLTIPEYLEEPINMPVQHVSVSLNVITNCDFNIAIKYSSNETPSVELQDINYENEIVKSGIEAINFTWPSTRMREKEIILLFNAKNFFTSNLGKTLNTKITITIAAAQDRNVRKEIIYSIIRYNSKYTKEELLGLDYEDEGEEETKKKYKEVSEKSFWYITNNHKEIVYYEKKDDLENSEQDYYDKLLRKANVSSHIEENISQSSTLLTRSILSEVEENEYKINFIGIYVDENEIEQAFAKMNLSLEKFSSSTHFDTMWNDPNVHYFSANIIENIDNEELYYKINYESAQKYRTVVNPKHIYICSGHDALISNIYQINENDDGTQQKQYYVNDEYDFNESMITHSYMINGSSLNRFAKVDSANGKLYVVNNSSNENYSFSTIDGEIEKIKAYSNVAVSSPITSNVYFMPKLLVQEFAEQGDIQKIEKYAKSLKISYIPVQYEINLLNDAKLEKIMTSASGNDSTYKLSFNFRYSYYENNNWTDINMNTYNRHKSYIFPVRLNVYDQDSAYIYKDLYIDHNDFSECIIENRTGNTYISNVNIDNYDVDNNSNLNISLASYSHTYHINSNIQNLDVNVLSNARLQTNRITVSKTSDEIQIFISNNTSDDVIYDPSYKPDHMIISYYLESNSILGLPKVNYDKESEILIVNANDHHTNVVHYNIENNFIEIDRTPEISQFASGITSLQFNSGLSISYCYDSSTDEYGQCLGYFSVKIKPDEPIVKTSYKYLLRQNNNYGCVYNYINLSNTGPCFLYNFSGSYVTNSENCWINAANTFMHTHITYTLNSHPNDWNSFISLSEIGECNLYTYADHANASWPQGAGVFNSYIFDAYAGYFGAFNTDSTKQVLVSAYFHDEESTSTFGLSFNNLITTHNYSIGRSFNIYVRDDNNELIRPCHILKFKSIKNSVDDMAFTREHFYLMSQTCSGSNRFNMLDISTIIEELMFIPIYMLNKNLHILDISSLPFCSLLSMNKISCIRQFIVKDENYAFKIKPGENNYFIWNVTNTNTNTNDFDTLYSNSTKDFFECYIKLDKNIIADEISDIEEFLGTEPYPLEVSVNMPNLYRFRQSSNYKIEHYCGFNIPYFDDKQFDEFMTPYNYKFECSANKITVSNNFNNVTFDLKYFFTNIGFGGNVQEVIVPLQTVTMSPGTIYSGAENGEQYPIVNYDPLGLHVNTYLNSPGTCAYSQILTYVEINHMYDDKMCELCGIDNGTFVNQNCVDINWDAESIISIEKDMINIDPTREVSLYMFNQNAYWCQSEENVYNDFILAYVNNKPADYGIPESLYIINHITLNEF